MCHQLHVCAPAHAQWAAYTTSEVLKSLLRVKREECMDCWVVQAAGARANPQYEVRNFLLLWCLHKDVDKIDGSSSSNVGCSPLQDTMRVARRAGLAPGVMVRAEVCRTPNGVKEIILKHNDAYLGSVPIGR